MRKVRFVEPVKVYHLIKEEIDAAFFEVMEKGDLVDRGQLKRFEENKNIYCNAHMGSKGIRKHCPIDDHSQSLLKAAIQKFGLSARAYD